MKENFIIEFEAEFKYWLWFIAVLLLGFTAGLIVGVLI